MKRCRSCLHDAQYDLPKLTKKIIYLDQFVISDMMKSINPRSSASTQDRVKFFRYLYEKLDRLSKLQLVVCPYSRNHTNESLVSDLYRRLERMYHQLSHGLSFALPEEIRKYQIHRNLKSWLGDTGAGIVASDAIQERVHDWQDRWFIAANTPYDQTVVDEITAHRDAVSAQLNTRFRNWQKETNTKFEDFYQRELDGFGETLSKLFDHDLQRSRDLLQRFYEAVEPGQVPDLDFALPSKHPLIKVVTNVLGGVGGPEKVSQKTKEYFLSDAIKEVPFVQISAVLYASLACQAVTNKEMKPPTQGMQSDIEFISSYSPYCDAIFVDQQCHRLLVENVPSQSPAHQVVANLGLVDKVYNHWC